MALPLIPLLLSVAPTVASWIMGDGTGKAVAKVAGIAREVIGTDDPDAIEKAIGADPSLALQFKLAVLQAEADERRAEREETMALIRDVQSAREQTVKLAEAKSPIAWGAPVISTIITLTFGVMLYLVMAKPVPGAESQAAQILLGVLATAMVQVVNYWLGSSRGSSTKDGVLAQLIQKAGR